MPRPMKIYTLPPRYGGLRGNASAPYPTMCYSQTSISIVVIIGGNIGPAPAFAVGICIGVGADDSEIDTVKEDCLCVVVVEVPEGPQVWEGATRG